MTLSNPLIPPQLNIENRQHGDECLLLTFTLYPWANEEEDSEPALKQIPNLKNPTNFPNPRGKFGTKTHFAIAAIAANVAIVVAADDDIADTNAASDFRLETTQ